MKSFRDLPFPLQIQVLILAVIIAYNTALFTGAVIIPPQNVGHFDAFERVLYVLLSAPSLALMIQRANGAEPPPETEKQENEGA